MGLLSFIFGKSKKEKEIDSLKDRLDNIENNIIEEKKSIVKAAVLVNNDITVIFTDGSFQNGRGDKIIINKILENGRTKDEILDMICPTSKSDKPLEHKDSLNDSQKATITKNSQILIDCGDFYKKSDKIYLVGTNIPIPEYMLFKFTEFVEELLVINNNDSSDYLESLEEKYQALKNFWLWCILCPNATSRNDLFKFLLHHDLKINKNGFFFAYRRVVSIDDKETENATFISSQWLKIKVKWKKNPKNFTVYKNEKGEYGITENSSVAKIDFQEKNNVLVGNLKELYESLAKKQEKVFTDDRTRSFDIKIGKEVSMDRKLCNTDNSVECSAGLHIGNKVFGFGGFGDTHILVLVNPMNTVSVPKHDSNKMRVCSYLPVAIIESEEEQTTFLENNDVMYLADDYFANQISELEVLAANKSEEFCNVGNIKELIISNSDIKNIKEILESRVKKAN